MASTKDASVTGVIDPQLAYTIEGAARLMGTTPRWITDTLLKPGLIPYTQIRPRSPIFIAGRDIVNWIHRDKKGGPARPQGEQQDTDAKPPQPNADQVVHLLHYTVPEPQPKKAKGKAKPALQLTLADDTLINKLGLIDLFGRSEQWVNAHFRNAPWIVAGEDRYLFWSDVKAHLKAIRNNNEATPEATR